MSKQKQVLVVDDNIINRRILSSILHSEYQILEAADGLEALNILREKQDKIALILLDIMMPVMDGYGFLTAKKGLGDLDNIPVIVTTQQDADDDEIRALSSGANDFVTKPYKPKVIRHRVNNLISLREKSQMVKQLREDSLTGVFNKDYFFNHALELMQEQPEKHFHILCCDIEHFKLINEVFGSETGDQILCLLAECLQDFAGEGGICGRLQADVFTCCLEARDYEESQFQAIVDQMNAMSLQSKIVVKFGIYTLEEADLSINAMCDRAMLTVKSIKGKYGSLFALYDDKMRQALMQNQFIVDNMEQGLTQHEFVVYFQPKHHLVSGAIMGAEALVRWKHPDRGLIPPNHFIPVFETNGFISKLDAYVWETTCQHIRLWMDSGLPVVPVSVNVSRADLYNDGLPSLLQSFLDRYELPPDYLHLEITESAYTQDSKQIVSMVSQLKDLGFMVEMDDFGTGYSSLNTLSELPFDILKLDMRFLDGNQDSQKSDNILRYVMSLASCMNVKVVAEGVETQAQLEKLRAMGCDYAQGYFFARPMPNDEFCAYLQSANEQ